MLAAIKMRYLIAILIFLTIACTQGRQSYDRTRLKSNYWISKQFDHYVIDSAFGGGKTIYGSAYLLNLESNQKVNFLSADFYWEKDSLYLGGEPGRTMKSGFWSRQNNNLVLEQKLISKMIMLTSDSIGKVESETLKIVGDSSLIYKRDTLIPLSMPSSELKTLMQRDWDDLYKTNGN
jgi:hypothetical protein